MNEPKDKYQPKNLRLTNALHTHVNSAAKLNDLLNVECGSAYKISKHLADPLLGVNSAQSALARISEGKILPLKKFTDAIQGLQPNGVYMQAAFDSITRNGAALLMHKNVIGPLDDLKKLSDRNLELQKVFEVSSAYKAWEKFNSQFEIPSISKFDSLAASFGAAGPFASIFSDTLVSKIAGMNSPWLNTFNIASSASAFAELQGIKFAVSKLDPFGRELTVGLRSDLGDWRDVNALTIGSNLDSRAVYYSEQGFRSELTNFPPIVFENSLGMEELPIPSPAIVEIFGEPVEPEENEDGSAFQRTNEAHLWLMRFEIQIRNFINKTMTEAWGEDWPKHKLPNGLYDSWCEKQEKAQQAGRKPCHIICFADFTDYERVINRTDNWNTVFKAIFRDPANVRESFNRMNLPRVETMHARPLSQDDQLLLYTEIKRFWFQFKRN
ncbi:MAG: hypothetical protein V4735_02095 [Pseudomonadota bacterium]